jgi:hypothetical protein
MITANILETCTSEIMLALTARERWGSATSGLNTSNGSIPTWLIVTGSAVLVILIASSIIVAFKHKPRKK